VADGAVSAVGIVIQIIISFAFLGIGTLIAIYGGPKLKPWVLDRVKTKANVSIQPRDELHMGIMFGALCIAGYIAYALIGSHLLGAFVAGMCFVKVPRSQQIWNNQMKRLLAWGVHIFFAATVGFAIPVKEMLTFDAFWRGAVLAIGPTIATKMISGMCAHMTIVGDKRKSLARRASILTRSGHVQPVQLLVGIAMVARGEFAYLVAKEARGLEDKTSDKEAAFMLSKETYAWTIWALVFATIASPVLFKWALTVYSRAAPIERGTQIGGSELGEDTEHKGRPFAIRIVGKHHVGLLKEMLDFFHGAGLDTLETRAESDGLFDVDVFTVRSRGKQADFDDEKLEEIRHGLEELLNDPDSQIVFHPIALETIQSTKVSLEIVLLGEHDPDILHEIADKLDEMELDVTKMHSDSEPQVIHGHKVLVDRNVIFAKDTKRDTITAGRRNEVRTELTQILEKRHLHGEMMIKVVRDEEVHIDHEEPRLGGHVLANVCIVTVVGEHHKAVLHEICDHFYKKEMVVLNAEVDKQGENDTHLFYIEKKTTGPFGEGAQKTLAEELRNICRSHDFDGEVAVLQASAFDSTSFSSRHRLSNGGGSPGPIRPNKSTGSICFKEVTLSPVLGPTKTELPPHQEHAVDVTSSTSDSLQVVMKV